MVKSNSEPDGALFRHAGNRPHRLTLPERFTTGASWNTRPWLFRVCTCGIWLGASAKKYPVSRFEGFLLTESAVYSKAGIDKPCQPLGVNSNGRSHSPNATLCACKIHSAEC
jgi:hypothetical protein